MKQNEEINHPSGCLRWQASTALWIAAVSSVTLTLTLNLNLNLTLNLNLNLNRTQLPEWVRVRVRARVRVRVRINFPSGLGFQLPEWVLMVAVIDCALDRCCVVGNLNPNPKPKPKPNPNLKPKLN